MEHTRFLVDPEQKKDPRWQPFITGITERALYVSSFLVDKGEFIIFWVTLKMALQYRRWTGEIEDKEGEETSGDKSEDHREVRKNDKALKGRQSFMNTLNGNGLSILHSFVSYLIILWLKDKEYYRVSAAIIISFTIWALSDITLELYIKRHRPNK
jgi:hypothetical protein